MILVLRRSLWFCGSRGFSGSLVVLLLVLVVVWLSTSLVLVVLLVPMILVVLCCRVSSLFRGKPCVTVTVMMSAVDITPEMSQVLKQKGIL